METILYASDIVSREVELIQVLEKEHIDLNKKHGEWESFKDENRSWLEDMKLQAECLRERAESAHPQDGRDIVPELPEFKYDRLEDAETLECPLQRETLAIQRWLLTKALMYLDHQEKEYIREKQKKEWKDEPVQRKKYGKKRKIQSDDKVQIFSDLSK
jgi:hypothetical protein